METDLRTDSSDYRTELLSPAAAGQVVTAAREPSWELNMDDFRLPERHVNSDFGCGYFFKSISMLFLSCLFIILLCLVKP